MNVFSSELRIVRRLRAFFGQAEEIDDVGPLIFSFSGYPWLEELL